MKSLEEDDGYSSTTSRYLNHPSRPMSIEVDDCGFKRDSENLVIGPESSNVSSRHHFGTHGIKPNLMKDQDKKQYFNSLSGRGGRAGQQVQPFLYQTKMI